MFTQVFVIIIIIVIPYKFFTLALADSRSLEFKWQQVSSSLQDSSRYSDSALVWMVSAYPPISNSSSPLTKPEGGRYVLTIYSKYHRHFPVL